MEFLKEKRSKVVDLDTLLRFFSEPVIIDDSELLRAVSLPIKNHRFDVVAPTIGRDNFYSTSITNNKLLLGLETLKCIHRGIAIEIESLIAKEGGIKSIFDLVKIDWALTSEELNELIECGALDSLEGNRAQKSLLIKAALDYGEKYRFIKKNYEEYKLKPLDHQPVLPNVPEWSFKEKLWRERSALGFTITELMIGKFII